MPGKASDILANLTAKYSSAYNKPKPGAHFDSPKQTSYLIHHQTNLQLTQRDMHQQDPKFLKDSIYNKANKLSFAASNPGKKES